MNSARRLMTEHPTSSADFGSAQPTAVPPAVPIRCAGLEIGGLPLPKHPGMASFRGMVDIAAGLGFEVLYINHPATRPSARLWDPLFADITADGLSDLQPDGSPVQNTNTREKKLDALWNAFLNFWNHRAENPHRWKSFRSYWKSDPTWRQDLSEYQVAAEVFGSEDWRAWPEPLNPDGLRRQVGRWRKNAPEIVEAQLVFFAYTQWIFFRQWSCLSQYAHLRGVDLATNVFLSPNPGGMETFFHSDSYQTNGDHIVPQDITSTLLTSANRFEGLFDILYLADAGVLKDSGHEAEIRTALKHPDLRCRVLLPIDDTDTHELDRMGSSLPCAYLHINAIAKELHCAHLVPDPNRLRRAPNWGECQKRIAGLLAETHRISHRHATHLQPALVL